MYLAKLYNSTAIEKNNDMILVSHRF